MIKLALNLDIEIGDYLLGGRFKNQRQKVKKLGRDELGQPTYNKGKKLLAVRIEKTMPLDKQSGKTKRERAETNKEAYLKSFSIELEKIAANYYGASPYISDAGADFSWSLDLEFLKKAINKFSVKGEKQPAGIYHGHREVGVLLHLLGIIENSSNKESKALWLKLKNKIDKTWGYFDQFKDAKTGKKQFKNLIEKVNDRIVLNKYERKSF
jgi:hypothetical protein